MIEKIVQISEIQNEKIKSLAESFGISEDEIIRHALDEFIRSNMFRLEPSDGRGLQQFLAIAQEISKKHHFPEGYRFSRDELYGEYNAPLPQESLPEKQPQDTHKID
jgi:hypothetical protein